MNAEPKKIVKEFTTYWSQEMVHAEAHKMSLAQQRFFDEVSKGVRTNMIIPDNISYSELLAFLGHKTKVTIEIIPHG